MVTSYWTDANSHVEVAVKNCNSVKDVRDAVRHQRDSMEQLKEESVSSFMSASQHEMEALFSILQDVEPLITQSDRSADIISIHETLLLRKKIFVWYQEVW